MKKNEETAKGFPTFLTSLLLYSVTGIILSLLLSLTSSILVLTELLPEDLIFPFSLFVIFVGSFLSSILSCKKLGKPIFTALVSGLLFTLIVFFVGSMLYGRLVPQTEFPITIACIFAGSVLGAVLSASGKSRRKHKK